MIRKALIEQILRQVYGEQPSDDASITSGLVNVMINQGLAIAAKQNYREAIQLDGIGYVNNSFYSTFSGTEITEDTTDNFQYYITLPQVPLGIGTNEGVPTLQFKYDGNNHSNTAIPMSMNQVGYVSEMRTIPNKILYYPENIKIRIRTTILLNIGYSWVVKVISGGDSTDLNSEIACPDDYIPIIISYVTQQLMMARNQPRDAQNDGVDSIKTT